MIGELHLIVGPMYSGKTSELIRKYNIYKLKYNCILINSIYDNRYDNDCVATHTGLRQDAISLEELFNIDKSIYKDMKVILIDESQFFKDLETFVLNAVEKDNKIVVVAGLNGDACRNDFGDISKLYKYSDSIQHLTGICYYCEKMTDAPFSLRIVNKDGQLMVGGLESYVSVCRKHYLFNKK